MNLDQHWSSLARMKVRWAGMEGYAGVMAASGWRFAVDRDLAYCGIRIAMQYGNNGLTYMMPEEPMLREMLEFNYSIDIPSGGPARETIVYMHSAPSFEASSFVEFDPRKSMYTPELQRGLSYEELFNEVFPPIDAVYTQEAKEIIVPDEQSVEQLMAMILDKQAPVQAGIRERNRKRERREAPSSQHASILVERVA